MNGISTASATSSSVAFLGSWGKALGKLGPFLAGSSRDAGEKGKENKPSLSSVQGSDAGETFGEVKGVKREASYDE